MRHIILINYIRPETAKELFNLRHASLRNVVERIFGVLKRKYKVLRCPVEYSIQTQVLLVIALTALHNFVRQHEGPNADDHLDNEVDTSVVEADDESELRQPEKSIFESGGDAAKIMDTFRDQIAQRMWKDYRQYQRSQNIDQE